MRTINDLQGDRKLNDILKKVKYVHFAEELETLRDLYLENTEDGDMFFLDKVIALEPTLKGEIRQGNISEKEMDYFFQIYGSVTNDKDL